MVYVNKIEVNVQEMFYYYKILIDKSISTASIVCMIIAQMKKFVYIMCGDLYVLRVISLSVQKNYIKLEIMISLLLGLG